MKSNFLTISLAPSSIFTSPLHTYSNSCSNNVPSVLINLSNIPFTIKPCDRIAQLVFTKYEQAEFVEVEELDKTERDEGGFGHTGTK